MLKHISWKTFKSNIKLISIVVIVLMALQMVTVYFVTAGRKVERFNSKASEAFSGGVASLEEKIDYMKEATLFIAGYQEVYHLMLSEQITSEDMFRFRSAAINLQKRLFTNTAEYFVYNELTGTVYTKGLQAQPIDELPDSKTKRALLGHEPHDHKIMFFVDAADFLTKGGMENSKQIIRFCYFPSRLGNSCLLLDMSLGQITEMFDSYQADFSSEIFMLQSDDSLLYGSDESLAMELQKDLADLANQNFNEPVFRRYGDRRYLVLRQYAPQSGLRVYSLIPDSAISVDYQETKTLLLTNLSLVIAICVILVLFIILKALNDAARENSRHQQLAEQERQHNQFMKNKQYIANCLFRPSEQDIRMAKEYASDLLARRSQGETKDLSGVMVLRFEICSYDAFLRKHSSKDVLLYKYGIVNICEEILNNHLQALSVYERDAEIIFVVIPGPDCMAVCERACRECQEAVHNYIAENLSAFLSSCGPIEELPELNSQTLQLSEYRFLLAEPLFLHAGYLEEVSSGGGQEMMERLEQFCIALEQADAESEIDTLFVWVRGLRLEDAKNALWMLMFRLYNTGKKAARSVDSIEALVSRFNRIRNLTEMKVFFRELCAAVYPKDEESGSSRKNHMVQKVLSIIEGRFQEAGFCSDHVAEEMHLSKAYLSRKFRQAADMSISEAINERRLEEFARLLVSTDKSVKSIIEDIGGVNHNYYMIMFKKKFQMTPTEYRQIFKKQTEI